MKRTERESASGFTLIELLVVIAVILVLAAVVFIGVGSATKAAYKAESVNNIRQLSSITLADASDNQGIFPEMHFNQMPFWFTWEWRTDADITREMAYCSANPCWKKDGYDYCQGSKRNLWEYGNKEESSIFGYSCVVNDTGWADDGEFLRPENWERIKSRVTGEDEMDVNWFLERTNQEVAYPILWMDVAMVWNNQRIGNFMREKDKIEGVHVGYMDGSIVWVREEELRARYRGAGLTLFW